MTISYENNLYALQNELPNDLTLNQENLKLICNYSLVPSPPPKMKILLIIVKKGLSLKLEIELFS